MRGIENLQGRLCAKIVDSCIGYGFRVTAHTYLITMMGMIAHIVRYLGREVIARTVRLINMALLYGAKIDGLAICVKDATQKTSYQT